MIIGEASLIPHTDVERFSWSSLRRFHHVPSVIEALIKRHSISNGHRSNAAKQAGQIRHCLVQAQEYREASKVVSLSTRPLLLYYSSMSLALAQILYKGSGADSLDAARGEHAHHGLLFNVSSTPKGRYLLGETASLLKASPMIYDNKRRGTFELWHRTAREEPIVGKLTRNTEEGSFTHLARVLLGANDKRMNMLPTDGMTLYDCFTGCPGMSSWLLGIGEKTKIVRGCVEGSIDAFGTQYTDIIIHPHPDPLRLAELKSDFIFSAASHECIEAHEFTNGLTLRIKFSKDSHYFAHIPPAISWNISEVRFLPSKPALRACYELIGRIGVVDHAF
ncbi:hypothetical protein [Methylobacterium sp. AMS5]|uniref:YaaC family protein n=1 Tax=Methylobacterium sp. AMS5 TaxID=925818 RepID=UPI000A462881|nr:hypothetical protein [Methylobacterium sp. AMS5]